MRKLRNGALPNSVCSAGTELEVPDLEDLPPLPNCAVWGNEDPNAAGDFDPNPDADEEPNNPPLPNCAVWGNEDPNTAGDFVPNPEEPNRPLLPPLGATDDKVGATEKGECPTVVERLQDAAVV